MQKILTTFILGTFLSSFSVEGATKEASPFRYWPYNAEGCHNTQDQFLIKSSHTSRFSKTTVSGKPCHIKTGKWIDIFSGEEITEAKNVLVVPIIPLKYIQKMQPKFSFKKIHQYVHDQDILIIIKKSSKSFQRYEENWQGPIRLPSSALLRCQFAGTWLEAKTKWSLSFSDSERNLLSGMVKTCMQDAYYQRAPVFGEFSRIPDKKCDTRIEVLKRDSSVPTRTSMSNRNKCTADLRGKWKDPYTNNVYTRAQSLDIDHIVPLKHVYMNGGWKWPWWKKKSYVNFQKNPFHLLAVDLSENRSKGEQPPQEYMPPNKRYHCNYLRSWIQIKFRWALYMDNEEKEFIKKKIGSCKDLNTELYSKIMDSLSSLTSENYKFIQ